MKASTWAWSYTGPKGEFSGYVKAVDPRDAVSRALTSQTQSGQLFGDEHGVPTDVISDAPANASTQYVMTGENFGMRVRKITCPSEKRSPDDLVGCGSANVSGPDDEGLFDCCDCGLFFNPKTAY